MVYVRPPAPAVRSKGALGTPCGAGRALTPGGAAQVDREAIQAQMEERKQREEAEKEAERIWGAPTAPRRPPSAPGGAVSG